MKVVKFDASVISIIPNPGAWALWEQLSLVANRTPPFFQACTAFPGSGPLSGLRYA